MRIFVSTELVVDFFEPGTEATEPIRYGGAGRFASIGAVKALQASDIGGHAHFVGPISKDPHGDKFRAILREAGVDLSYAWNSDKPSMQARVFPKPGGGNDYNFPIEEPADRMLSRGDLPKLGQGQGDFIDPRGQIFIFGSVSSVLQPAGTVWLEFAREVRAAGGIVIFDLNARAKALPVTDGLPDWKYFRANLEKWLDVAQIIKASDEDLAHAFSGQEPLDIMKSWVTRAECAVVTLGSKGSCAISKLGESATNSGTKLNKDEIITVGAGDNFLAGLAVTVGQMEAQGAGHYLKSLSYLLEQANRAAVQHLLGQNLGVAV